MFKLIAVTCLLAIGLASGEKARFDNYRLYSLKIENEAQLNQLRIIDGHLDGYQMWDYPSQVGASIKMVVPPHKFSDFSELQEMFDIKVDLLVNNLQENIDNEQSGVQSRAVTWDAYYRYDQITGWFDELAAAYPGIVTVVVGGTTYEGRQIKGVKVSYKAGNSGVFIEGGMHAREWVSPATSTFILNQLLTSTDASIREIAENYDWYIFPVTNPDGYEYTHTTNRLWRKTRSLTSGCYGADPNRNWGYNWDMGGSSNQPCSDTFHGTAAFSEVETRTLSNYYKTLNKMSTYISFHSYGQMLLVPFGHTTDHLGNYNDLISIGSKALAKLRERFGTAYTLGNIAETIYTASGGSIDWIKGEVGTGLTYCYELRDTGTNGFTLPASQIVPTAQETLDSIVVMLREGKVLGYH